MIAVGVTEHAVGGRGVEVACRGDPVLGGQPAPGPVSSG
ncbi:hypothetical protein BZL30_4842 [Mycobacterium kansasii]|uniref:Uncharacterized protein n=1 Tax=Mycobacterium kansasii TaxID=1768 RepID=A0A1V3X2W9_MYCKA|nr:hypothetical protein BZL30_4842 [Mycobacterium kansasii]